MKTLLVRFRLAMAAIWLCLYILYIIIDMPTVAVLVTNTGRLIHFHTGLTRVWVITSPQRYTTDCHRVSHNPLFTSTRTRCHLCDFRMVVLEVNINKHVVRPYFPQRELIRRDHCLTRQSVTATRPTHLRLWRDPTAWKTTGPFRRPSSVTL